MRTTLLTLTLASVFTAAGMAQAEKTFYFTQPIADADLTAATTMVRTIVDLQDIQPDVEHRALKLHGPEDKLMAADWVLQQLDHPAASAASAEYKMSGPHEEAMQMLRISPKASNADLSALTTAIRTVADLQRLFPYQRLNILAARGEPAKVALAAWIVRQLSPFDGEVPTGDSPTVPSPIHDTRIPAVADVVQIVRMDPKTTKADLTATVTAIRVVADVQRLFPFFSASAIIGSGAPEKMAVAEWLVSELRKPADPDAVHQTALPGSLDDVVRLFYTGRPVDFAELAKEIRSTTGIQRVLPMEGASAVIVRGRPDQMTTVQTLVSRFPVPAQ